MSRPDPLQPAYDFSASPEPVHLMVGTTNVAFRDTTFSLQTDLLLKFRPNPRLLFHTSSQGAANPALLLLANDRNDPSLFFNEVEIKGFVGMHMLDIDTDTVVMDWYPKSEPVMLSDMSAKTSVLAILHIFNFPAFFRRGTPHVNEPSGCTMLVLEADEWRISIQSLPKNGTKQAWDRIKQEDGCLLTHVAKLERKDGQLFSGTDAREQILLLNSFLSFTIGGRHSTACEVGFDGTGKKTWEAFSSPRFSTPPYSWFSPHHGSQAEILFPLFAKRWQQSEEWKKCLHSAIYWYTQANTGRGSPGIDSAIILAQAAFERLAYQHLVVDKKMISPEGLSRLKASDQLRLLFSSLDIPVSIGDATPSIKGSASQLKWEDAPHALTEIRNELVHPVSKKRIRACIFDAWKLSLWYLELSVLALCGYDDTYTNRLTAKYVGESEKVPWSKAV